jgi:arylsulfatase I/J
MPWQRGFDSYYGFVCNGALDNLYKTSDGYTDFWRDGQIVLNSSITTRTSTLWDQHAVRFIREHAAEHRPSFVYYALQDPHAPLQAPDEYTYSAPCSHISDESRQIYCGMLKAIDNSVFEIMSAIESVRANDSTIVCFSGDNGGSPNSGGYNWPLRGSKGSLYEGGIRQASWCWASEASGMLSQHVRGTVYHGPMHLVDFYPTFLALATAGHWRNAAGMASLDGVNVWTAISTGSPSPRNETLLNAVYDTGAIRVGDYVLLVDEETEGYSGHPDGIYDSTYFNTYFGYVDKSKASSGDNNGGESGDQNNRDDDYDDGAPYLELYNVVDDPYQYTNLISVTDSDGNLLHTDRIALMLARLQDYMVVAVDPEYDSETFDQAEEQAEAYGYWGPWVQTLDEIPDSDDGND